MIHVTSDEKDLFAEEMAGVRPLKREPRVRLRKDPSGSGDPSLSQRREAAVRELGRDNNTLSEEGIEPLDPWYVLEFKRPGVQHGVYRKLKQGRYEMDARLDLHRMSAARARREVFDFLEEARRLGLRTILLVHGKGDGRAGQERSSILKGCVNQWLRELEVVQAFHSAQPRHGGTGAVYVLLRKSEEKKRENRERFLKGRVAPE